MFSTTDGSAHALPVQAYVGAMVEVLADATDAASEAVEAAPASSSKSFLGGDSGRLSSGLLRRPPEVSGVAARTTKTLCTRAEALRAPLVLCGKLRDVQARSSQRALSMLDL